MFFGKSSNHFAAVPLKDDRERLLRQFLNRTNSKIKNILLLETAFRHRSASNEVFDSIANNERFEFLGDAILEFVTVDFLFKKFPDKTEGELSKIKAAAVSEPVLSEVALKFKVDECIVLGRGEELSGGRRKKALLADAMEAIIAAFYLDSGFAAAKNFILSFIPEEIQKIIEGRNFQDYKTALQEEVQKRYKNFPAYEMIKKEGPDHDQTFWISVKIGEETFGPARGKNKKDAEQAAAKIAWEALFRKGQD